MSAGNDGGSRSLRTLVLLATTRASVLLCSVFSVRISTEVLQAEGMGVMNLVLSAINLFALVNGAVSLYFYRQLVAWDNEDRLLLNIRRYAYYLGGAGLLAVMLTPIIYASESSPWTLISPMWMGSLLACNILINSLAGALLNTLNTLGWRMAFAVLSNLACWGGVAFAWAFTSIAGTNAEIWMSGLLAAQFLTLLLAGITLGKGLAQRGPLGRDKQTQPTDPFSLVPVMRFAWPLLICTALFWVQRNTFSPWLAAETDAATLGRFSVAFALGLLAISSFDTLYRELYGPTYYRAAANANHYVLVKAWQSYAFELFPMLIICLSLIAACGDALLSLLTAKAFHGLGIYVLAGATAQFWISIYSTYVILASSYMDNRILILPNVAGAIATAGLLAWSPVTEPMATAALAINAGLATTALVAGWELHRRHKPALPWRSGALASIAALPLWVPSLVGDGLSWPNTHPIAGPLIVVALASTYAMVLLYLWSRRWVRSLR
jgi:hypothetical protein